MPVNFLGELLPLLGNLEPSLFVVWTPRPLGTVSGFLCELAIFV